MTKLRVVTDITQRHIEVDMMHNAIRADVLASIVAANSHDSAAATEARQPLDEHSKLLRDNLNSKENI